MLSCKFILVWKYVDLHPHSILWIPFIPFLLPFSLFLYVWTRITFNWFHFPSITRPSVKFQYSLVDLVWLTDYTQSIRDSLRSIVVVVLLSKALWLSRPVCTGEQQRVNHVSWCTSRVNNVNHLECWMFLLYLARPKVFERKKFC